MIRKSARTLELFDGDQSIKMIDIVLGSAPSGTKLVEGDGRTPEGSFYIFTKNRESKFHRSLAVSYPDRPAAERGLAQALITREEFDAIVDAVDTGERPPQKTRLGGEIYIHGGGTDGDWTQGCIAVDDRAIEELFDAVTVGCPVVIEP